MAIGLIGILAALVVLIGLVIKKVNIVIASIAGVAVLCIFGGLNFYTELSGDWADGLAGFMKTWLIVFFLGSVFGKIMDITGSAQAIADFILKYCGDTAAIAVLPIVICLMVYGGVSGFVVVFTIWPMMDRIWRRLDAPRRFLPSLVQFGAGTACNGGPGAPSALNLVSTQTLGVLPSAGFIIGMIGNVVVMGLGIACYYWVIGRARKRGEHYLAPGAEDYIVESKVAADNAPNGLLALLPLAATIVALNLKSSEGGSLIPIEYAMAIGVLVLIIVNFSRLNLTTMKEVLNDCVPQALVFCANYGCISGFGNVVKAMPVFQMVVDAIPSIPFSPIVTLVIATNIMCAMTGTATGAATLVAPILGPIFTGMGMPAETVARIIAFSATGFDSVPHNSGVFNYIYTFGHENMKTAYPMVFLTSVICPLIATIVMILAAFALGVAG